MEPHIKNEYQVYPTAYNGTASLTTIGMEKMNTLSQSLNLLRQYGYTIDFNLRSENPMDAGNLLERSPELFLIDGFYRFEGETDPDDEAILCSISSIDGRMKGVFVDGYGISSDSRNSDILKKLQKRSHLTKNLQGDERI